MKKIKSYLLDMAILAEVALIASAATYIYADKRIKPTNIYTTVKVEYAVKKDTAKKEPVKKDKGLPVKVTNSKAIGIDDAINSNALWIAIWDYESRSGKNLFQGKNKNCKNIKSPCGHFQLAMGAVKDIGGKPKDRVNFEKSLIQAKKYMRYSYSKQPERVKRRMTRLGDFYLMHQQGPTGYAKYSDATVGYKIASLNKKALLNNLSKRLKKKYKHKSKRLIFNRHYAYWQIMFSKKGV